MLGLGEEGGYFFDIAIFFSVIQKGAFTCTHSYANSAAVVHKVKAFDNSHLSRICHVRGATGAAINFSDFYYSHVFCKIKL